MNDVIAAVSTPWGESGIAVVRLSGPGSLELAAPFLVSGSPFAESAPRMMKLCRLVDKEGNLLDQVLAVWFREPSSYTGEESVEIHCHGGGLVARLCLENLLKTGARPAEAGEFTQRAFLSGRIDLAQAESVLGVIRARSEEALKAAARSLTGEFSQKVREIREELITLSAHMEAGLDFPEEDIPPLDNREALKQARSVRDSLEELLNRSRSGRMLREGVRVALAGRPNVGKSSLLNALLQEARAIVTAIPGTTRDIIEEVLNHKGVPLRLVDTAGIRSPSNDVEAIGVERARRAFHEADIRIWVVDGSERLTPEDTRLAQEIAGVPHLAVINKSDLPLETRPADMQSLLPDSEPLVISAALNTGVEELKDRLVSMAGGDAMTASGLNTTARQVNELQQATDLMNSAVASLAAQDPADMAAEALAQTRYHLDRLLGEAMDDSLLDTVFSAFCIGK